MTKAYKTFTRQFKKLQKKYERFEYSDDTRIREIWQMNEQEAKTLVEKIMHADKVIHLQQLSIPWKPPSDAFFGWLSERAQADMAAAGENTSFGGAASATQGNSVTQQQNTSVLDSNKPGVEQQSRSDADDASNMTGKAQGADVREKFARITAVFRLLIEEADYLIDGRALERCEGQSAKEQFAIKIDSIRKSLGIDNMEDVELLVDTLYTYESSWRKAQVEIRKKEETEFIEACIQQGNPNPVIEDAKNGHEDDSEDEERDPSELWLDPDHLTAALEKFHQTREDRAVENELNAPSKAKKKSNFETEEQKAERQKRKQQIYWEKMTTILSSQKLSVWKALDRALTKYYQLLVERQNLIEDTGLLNQQNEELKTLLNQYLQAGVNQELQVPPTQVIRLDI